MKKQALVLLFVALLTLPLNVHAVETTYGNDFFSFCYDDEVFSLKEVPTQSGTKTFLVLSDNSDKDTPIFEVKTDSASEAFQKMDSAFAKKSFLESYARTMCIGEFIFLSDLKIESEEYTKNSDIPEYHMTLSDGSECFAKAFEHDGTISCALCRLFTYTEDFNDGYKEIYDSVKSPSSSQSEDTVEMESEISETTFDFRGYKWGTSIDEIKQNEISPDMVENVDYGFSDNLLLIFNGKVSSYNATIFFEFDSDNKLVAGSYALDEEHTDDSGYYSDFTDLAKLYSKKYGTPRENDVWKNDLYKNDKTKWGFAAACGHALFSRYWEASDGSEIFIILQGDNFKANTAILYRSPQYNAEDDMAGI